MIFPRARHAGDLRTRGYRLVLLKAAVTVGLAGSTNANAQPAWTQAGMLNCTLAPSVGFLIAGQQRMTCRFTPNQSTVLPENYTGVMTTVGIDIGVTAGGAFAWAVLARTTGLPVGALAGTYVGASGEVTLGLGAGANVLLGGSARSVALQPVSVEGSAGLDFQLGMSGLELRPVP
jgi:Protein of unknown function (DUF992)